jgi:hypothetical protein
MQCDLPPWRPRMVQSEPSNVGRNFFNGIERLKGGGSQPFLDTGPICRRQRLLNALLWDGNCAGMNSRSADHRRFD